MALRLCFLGEGKDKWEDFLDGGNIFTQPPGKFHCIIVSLVMDLRLIFYHQGINLCAMTFILTISKLLPYRQISKERTLDFSSLLVSSFTIAFLNVKYSKEGLPLRSFSFLLLLRVLVSSFPFRDCSFPTLLLYSISSLVLSRCETSLGNHCIS